MAICHLTLQNFKGVGDRQDLPIKPLTIFIGANSSGKSTCIHALAALSQSVKIPNSSKPIVLDDEYAFVHLGRFINIIHSKSYQDSVCIGFTAIAPSVDTPLFKGKVVPVSGEFFFRTVLRTQETFIEKAVLKAGAVELYVSYGKKGHVISNNQNKQTIVLATYGLSGGRVAGRISKESLDTYLTFAEIMNIIVNELDLTRYLGPFRQQPQRAYQSFSSVPREVGGMGESTAALLTNEIVQKRKREHIEQIASWLGILQLGNSIDVSRLGKSNLFEIKVETDAKFVIADLGYGMSQVLPVLAQCSFAPLASTLLFEQPEIHLHPLASAGLARVFMDVVNKKRCSILVESHSEDLIRAVQIGISDGRFQKEHVAIYAVNRREGQSMLRAVDINDDGEIFDNWKVGFSQEY
jgi:hypothetical protein